MEQYTEVIVPGSEFLQFLSPPFGPNLQLCMPKGLILVDLLHSQKPDDLEG